jgi:hypothetical protein
MITASRLLSTALWGRLLAACSAEPHHQPGSSGAAAPQTRGSPIAICPKFSCLTQGGTIYSTDSATAMGNEHSNLAELTKASRP